MLGSILVYVVDGCGISVVFFEARKIPKEDFGEAVADCQDGVRGKRRAEAETHVEFVTARYVEL